MTRVFTLPILLTVGLLVGCLSRPTGAVLPPVGPVPGQTPTGQATSQAGALLVYTAPDVNPNFDGRDEYLPHYTDYQIMTGEGRFLQTVHNDSGTLRQNPVRVKLPAGNYRVVAWANGRGLVTVPVIVAAQQITVVHLDKDVKREILGARGL